MNRSVYQSPLATRYCSEEMRRLFSDQFKYTTWRRLWVALAEAQKELGLPITESQIKELKENVDKIDFDAVEAYEKELHHDVMAHIRAYSDLCPQAGAIIHLGSTSCYVTDNADLLQMKEGLLLLVKRLKSIISSLSKLAEKTKALPCLGYTHYQPAQLTTVGKRFCLWIQDLKIDLSELEGRLNGLKFLGAKGATGTQAAYLDLFEGNAEKVRKLDALIASKMGFEAVYPISGQTYTRKLDALILSSLASLASSLHKMGTDLRLLAHDGEILEGFGESQVGSSAMPYKRNPMLAERVCSLSRFVIALSENGSYTHATQWLERSLDDSANRRLTLSESFLATDALLMTAEKLVGGLVINEGVIAAQVSKHLPYIATEMVLMEAVKKGGDRQALHEKLRKHSHQAASAVKPGDKNSYLKLIAEDPAFPFTMEELLNLMKPERFIGLAADQTERFLNENS